MSKTLHVAHGFSLPLDTVTQSLAILAKRRAGKSYTARRITEQFAKAHLQTVIVDPKGDWWGVRSAADGKSPGLPITILGGAHGDLPLEVGSGEVVAKLVVFECVSILLDLSNFRKSEVARFMSDFLEAFYRLKAAEEYRSPVMLVVDEADAIAPQKPFKGEERMLGAIEDIVRRGGQRGIGCLLISQRSAVLNKNVLTQVQVLVTMRTIAPQDLDAMNAWIDVHGTAEERKVLMESLPSLPVGDAWFWSPGWPTEEGIFKRVHVLPIETFDSGATPKPGERRIEPKNLADVDLDALRRQMAETIERAQAADPKKLQARLATLREAVAHAYQLAGAYGAPAEVLDNYTAALQGKAAPHKYKTVAPQARAAASKEIPAERLKKEFERGAQAERKRLRDGFRQRLVSISHRLKRFEEAMKLSLEGDLAGDVLLVIGQLDHAAPVPEMAMAAAASVAPVRSPAPAPARSLAVGARPAVSKGDPDAAVTAPERRILTVLAQRPQGVDLDRLAILAGYTVNGHFNNILGGLRGKSFVTPARVVPIQATSEGLVALGEFEPLPTGQELQAWWLQRLTAPEARILSVLFKQYPQEIALDELAQKAGYTVNGHFNNIIGSLRTKGLMTPQRRPILASADFFEG